MTRPFSQELNLLMTMLAPYLLTTQTDPSPPTVMRPLSPAVIGAADDHDTPPSVEHEIFGVG
jgi:hypothetical protein